MLVSFASQEIHLSPCWNGAAMVWRATRSVAPDNPPETSRLSTDGSLYVEYVAAYPHEALAGLIRQAGGYGAVRREFMANVNEITPHQGSGNSD